MRMTGNQFRAARALLGLTREEVAAKAGVSLNTIRNIEERGPDEVRVTINARLAVKFALEDTGIDFLFENGGGLGVVLRGKY